MSFEEIVDQALAMLQRRGRVAYRTLKRQFQLDEDALEDLKTELIKAQRLAVDEDGEVLVWTGVTASAAAPAAPPPGQAQAPLTYRLPRRKREILYAGAFRARSMRPALSLIFIPNELIRHCFLRWQAEKLPPTLGHHEKRSRGFSCNPRLLTVPTSADLSRRSCLAYKISPILRASLHGWCGNPQESHGSGYHAR
jgi:hypothetical protein